MITAVTIVIASGVLGLLLLGLRAYLRMRGKRLVTCPETGKPAGVEVNPGRAVRGSVLGRSALRLQECSRWPERQHCGQECLKEIEAAPEGCLIRTMVGNWYRGKSCAICSQPLGDVDWYQHKPGVMNSERKTFEWKEIPPETISGVLETNAPVCWNCHIAESFRRLHPDLVLDRDSALK
jgi:hypothetical protein